MEGVLNDMLAINIAEFLRIVATNCSEGLAWLLGILGTVGTGTIIGAIIAIIKSKIQSKKLIESVNESNKANANYLKEQVKEFETKINEALSKTETNVDKYGKDNSLIGELLLMISSKLGFTSDEIVKVANKYKELPLAKEDVASSIVNDVTKENDAKEQLKDEETRMLNNQIESLNQALNSLKEQENDKISNEANKDSIGLRISL